MNLKEAFRYQNFLDNMMANAEESLRYPSHHMITKRTHLRSKTNSADSDYEEIADASEFVPDDTVVGFASFLIDEKTLLGVAISKAKAKASTDIDASIAANKYRQRLCSSISNILRCKTKRTVERGQGYCFNNEGVQMPYVYEIDVETIENFDRLKMKNTLRALSDKADAISNEVDSVMINTQVDYEPVLDVNGSFEDSVERYIEWLDKPTS